METFFSKGSEVEGYVEKPKKQKNLVRSKIYGNQKHLTEQSLRQKASTSVASIDAATAKTNRVNNDSIFKTTARKHNKDQSPQVKLKSKKGVNLMNVQGTKRDE